MSKISIHVSGLRHNMGNMSNQLNQLQQLNQKLDGMINVIEGSWQGTASAAYVTMMRNYLKQGRKMEKVMQEFVRYADNVSSRFDECDRNAARKISSSF